MTATADRFGPGRSREELRLVEVASGLLLLLDAYRLTGRLPLEVPIDDVREAAEEWACRYPRPELEPGWWGRRR